MKNQIFVTGATGHIGSRTIKNLVEHLKKRETTQHIYAGVHKKEVQTGLVQQMSALGIQIVEIDANKPETLDKAFKNIQKLFIIPSNGNERLEQGLSYIEAASRANVNFVLLLSVINAESRHDLLGHQFMALEAALAKTGLKYCILRVGFFMQDFLTVKSKIKEGKLAMPLGSGMFAPVHWDDIARAAAAILDKTEEWEGKTQDLVGPELLTGNEIAERATKYLGHKVQYVPTELNPESFKRHLIQNCGFTENDAEALKQQCELVKSDGLKLDSPGVKEIERAEGKSIDTFFMENKKLIESEE